MQQTSPLPEVLNTSQASQVDTSNISRSNGPSLSLLKDKFSDHLNKEQVPNKNSQKPSLGQLSDKFGLQGNQNLQTIPPLPTNFTLETSNQTQTTGFKTISAGSGQLTNIVPPSLPKAVTTLNYPQQPVATYNNFFPPAPTIPQQPVTATNQTPSPKAVRQVPEAKKDIAMSGFGNTIPAAPKTPKIPETGINVKMPSKPLSIFGRSGIDDQLVGAMQNFAKTSRGPTPNSSN